MPNPFLTAHWRNLINLTYRVPPSLLKQHVPKGVELDIQEGDAFVSLVAFEFLNTKVKGLKIPFHVDFPEINLRYYVKYKGKNAVCFIREFVPKYCIATIANRLYNEPYLSIPYEMPYLRNGKDDTSPPSVQLSKTAFFYSPHCSKSALYPRQRQYRTLL